MRESTKGSPSVLIVTHRRALEVDGVIDKLRELNARVTRMNFCEFPGRNKFAFTPLMGMTRPSGRESRYDAGWLHDTGAFSTARSLTGLDRDVSLRECSSFLRGYTLCTECNWLNDPKALEIASNKMFQLKTAADLGIPVPAFVVTNNPATARTFLRKYSPSIVKTLGTGYINYGRRSLKFYTRRVSELSDNFLEGLSSGPLMFQREIEKKREIRVTVVGSDCFSIEFDCSLVPDRYVDIRQINYEDYRSGFRKATGVKQIEAWSKAIVAKLNLSYAGIDWALDQSGSAFFLECNPLGSFKWSEICGDYKITEAIAHNLIRKTRERRE